MEEDWYSLTLAQVGHNVDKVEVRQNTIHSLCATQGHKINYAQIPILIFIDR